MKWKWISGEKNLRRNKFLLFFYITICVFNYPSVKLVSPATWSLSKHLCSWTECPVMLLYSIMFWFCMNWWVKQTVFITSCSSNSKLLSSRIDANWTEQNRILERKVRKQNSSFSTSRLNCFLSRVHGFSQWLPNLFCRSLTCKLM